MTQAKVELVVGRTQNDEPYVRANFGPDTTTAQQDTVLSMLSGYGLSCGYGPGPSHHAKSEANRVARRLRRLGWSVSIQG